LQRICLKWVRTTHLGTLNTSYGQKKGQESNCPQPLKVKNRLDLLMCGWHGTYYWKVFNEGYNFALNLTSVGNLHTKLWASKVVEIPGQNDIWVLAPLPGIENTIKGKEVASPKYGSWWVLWVCVCPWFIHAQKVLQLCINQLVVWFVQVHVNNWPTCHLS
jgi:hypothetical protein